MRRLHAEGATVKAAAAAIGRGVEATRNKGKTIGLTFAKGDKARKARPVVERAPDAFIRPPTPVYRDRMAVMFGDPPIGRSALDRRSA